jgi:hypothetical protein
MEIGMRARAPRPRKVKVWVYLILSLLLALVLLALEIGVLSLFVDLSRLNKTLYDILLYPLWALNAFPAGYILRALGLRAYSPAPARVPTEGSQPTGKP